jgi:hypothetical protein
MKPAVIFETLLKFRKIFLSSPKYFYVSETHRTLTYNVFLYTYILDGAGLTWRDDNFRTRTTRTAAQPTSCK